MNYLEPCLVLNRATGRWSIEDRPPLPPAVEPWSEWSSDVWSYKLKTACEGYRKRGDRLLGPSYYLTRNRREAKARLRRKAKFMEAAE